MPNSQIKNLTPSLRNTTYAPNSKSIDVEISSNIKRINVYSRTDTASAITVIEGTSGGGSTFAGKGYLIGMMAIPYITTQTAAGSTTIAVTYVGPKPNMRIQ